MAKKLVEAITSMEDDFAQSLSKKRNCAATQV